MNRLYIFFFFYDLLITTTIFAMELFLNALNSLLNKKHIVFFIQRYMVFLHIKQQLICLHVECFRQTVLN